MTGQNRSRSKDALAILSPVLGVLGLLTVRTTLLALALALAAIVVAIISTRTRRADGRRRSRWALLGLILGWVAIALAVLPYLLAPILIAMGKLT